MRALMQKLEQIHQSKMYVCKIKDLIKGCV
jgi:hypothetical protein